MLEILSVRRQLNVSVERQQPFVWMQDIERRVITVRLNLPFKLPNLLFGRKKVCDGMLITGHVPPRDYCTSGIIVLHGIYRWDNFGTETKLILLLGKSTSKKNPGLKQPCTYLEQKNC